MPETGFNPRDAHMVARTVNTWIGNPLSRGLLKFVCGNSGNGNRLDLSLRRYSGEKVPLPGFRDKLASMVVDFIIGKGARSFGVEENYMREGMKDVVLRRALVNVLEGIAHFGVMRPQTTIAPFLVVWNFTHACNLRCKHCYENAGDFLKDELTTEEAKKVVDEFREAGVVAIAFSGGEPLLRKDFFEVARYAHDQGFYVSVASNGTLITPSAARKIRDSGIEYAEISLDGFEKEHDGFRGVKGSWKRTCRGIKNCVKVGLDTCVATTATRHNLKNLPKLVDFVEKDLKANRTIVFNFVPTRRGKEIIENDLDPHEREELQRFLYSKLMNKSCMLNVLSTAPQYARVALEFAEGPAVMTHFTNKAAMNIGGKTKTLGEFIGGCGAGRIYCGLEPNGDIQPCVFIPIKIGNIREDSIKDVWRKHPLLWKMRRRDEFEGCGDCEYRYVCGGCRARAYGYYGDLQAPDPGCIRNLSHWKRLKNGNAGKKSG